MLSSGVPYLAPDTDTSVEGLCKEEAEGLLPRPLRGPTPRRLLIAAVGPLPFAPVSGAMPATSASAMASRRPASEDRPSGASTCPVAKYTCKQHTVAHSEMRSAATERL